jgi:hypothetical protein
MGDAATSRVKIPKDHSYSDLKQQLLSKKGLVLSPLQSAPSQSVTHAISSLFLHPSIEAALHLLNDDLVSAHFLVRHMQAAPQYESMMLHGILHRIEGDYENAKAWYRDVQNSEVFLAAWGGGGLHKVMDFVRRIEILKKETKQRDISEAHQLEDESKREITTVLDFCEKKFGTQKVDDASAIWVQDEKSSAKGGDMVVGGEGWRQF